MLKSRDSILAPDYPRIPHIRGFNSRMTADDIDADRPQGSLYVEEKVDAANCGVSWTGDGPLLRNRSHILNKAFNSRKNTPAKAQFKPAWNWLYEHESGIRTVLDRLGSDGTIYGEWMWAEHSIPYDALPDFFIAYDVWDATEQKFVSPGRFESLFEDTGLAHVTPYWVPADGVSIQHHLNQPSAYRTGSQIREGVVLKTVDEANRWTLNRYKIVRGDFSRMDDEWNDRVMKRNRLKRG